MTEVVRDQESVPRRTRRTWLRIFLVGLALWVATVVVIFLTGNPNLIPTLVLLGSFLVPVTFVAWAFGRRGTGELTAGLVFSTFLQATYALDFRLSSRCCPRFRPPRCFAAAGAGS